MATTNPTRAPALDHPEDPDPPVEEARLVAVGVPPPDERPGATPPVDDAPAASELATLAPLLAVGDVIEELAEAADEAEDAEDASDEADNREEGDELSDDEVDPSEEAAEASEKLNTTPALATDPPNTLALDVPPAEPAPAAAGLNAAAADASFE